MTERPLPSWEEHRIQQPVGVVGARDRDVFAVRPSSMSDVVHLFIENYQPGKKRRSTSCALCNIGIGRSADLVPLRVAARWPKFDPGGIVRKAGGGSWRWCMQCLGHLAAIHQLGDLIVDRVLGEPPPLADRLPARLDGWNNHGHWIGVYAEPSLAEQAAAGISISKARCTGPNRCQGCTATVKTRWPLKAPTGTTDLAVMTEHLHSSGYAHQGTVTHWAGGLGGSPDEVPAEHLAAALISRGWHHPDLDDAGRVT